MTADLVATLRAAGCVFAEEEAAVILGSARDDAEVRHMVASRVAGMPLEHVVGWVEFLGRRVCVVPGVFVPRRRTEALALAAIDRAQERAAAHSSAEERSRATQGTVTVVELCCGAAAVAAAVAASVPTARVIAADLDPVAVRCAHDTLEPLGGRVLLGDLFDTLPSTLRGGVDVLVANAPYVPTGAIATMPAEAREHEPALALDGGSDGLDLHRRIAGGAAEWLAPDGVVLIETSAGQAGATARLLESGGFALSIETDAGRGATIAVGVHAATLP
ncbi:putative protein N(5)-glutamine methyltransferase [Marisediminicola sp. LYQ134]|uniref:putative protein N(5)-glutamine methyltransferase n=1 Tax=Marisediminicola sp. LYQ134 TaxID=3391061 RepID=UPI0039839BE7